ncbi:MAG: hypothetical protein OEZ39_05440 [Gammaproteobacteria bacterium]|nr:hypothetical protein [Gammaproteobacteria bacterium]
MPLPDITIKINEPAYNFLSSMQKILQDDIQISEVRTNWDVMGDGEFSIVAVMPKDQNGNTQLIGQLISKKKDAGRIEIEIRAQRWANDFPSQEEYAQYADNIFKPALNIYNRKNGTKCRLTIHKIRKKQIVLPPGAEKHFKLFTMYPESGIAHPLERCRFHAFIKHCHRHGVKLNKYEFKMLLLKKGFNEKEAEKLSGIYVHGREILSVKLHV